MAPRSEGVCDVGESSGIGLAEHTWIVIAATQVHSFSLQLVYIVQILYSHVCSGQWIFVGFLVCFFSLGLIYFEGRVNHPLVHFPDGLSSQV